MSSTDLCGGRQAVACIDGGQGDDGPETGPAVDEADIAAVIAHDAARNGKPKADTAGFMKRQASGCHWLQTCSACAAKQAGDDFRRRSKNLR